MKTLLQIIVLTFFCATVTAVDLDASDSDWLLARNVELYMTVLQDRDVPTLFKERIKAQLHRFAFEYWLKGRNGSKAKSLYWHGQIRRLLSQEGKSPRLIKDPLLLATNFVNGKISNLHVTVPVANLDLTELKQVDYQKLASEFGDAFCDFGDFFPVAPFEQSNFVVSADGTLNPNQTLLLKYLKGKSWRVLAKDRLPISYQKEPFTAFAMLTRDAQAYFLPAFLRMCEREPELTADLLKSLSNSWKKNLRPESDFRSKLTERQKACVAAFFREALSNNDQKKAE